MMKIGIGTVQFGMDYGISNPEGRPPIEEVNKILEVAASNGIRVIDTAALYGNSEEILGKAWPDGYIFDVVTKTARFSKSVISETDVRQLENTLHRSLRNMCISSVYGLLIHHAEDLLVDGGQLLIEKMLELKQKGLIEKIGVSVYTAEQIDRILDKFSIDLIQLPISILDQRLLKSGHLMKLKKKGIEIHARSVFLQGLLLMDIEIMPPYFNLIKEHLFKLREYLKGQKLSPLEAALNFVIQQPEINAAIVGVNTASEFQEIMRAVKYNKLDQNSDYSIWAVEDENIINPSLWRYNR